jgi:hypothetical protein
LLSMIPDLASNKVDTATTTVTKYGLGDHSSSDS